MLSSQKHKIYLERLHQLKRLGFSMPFEFSLLNNRPSEVELEQCPDEVESPVIDLPDEQTLFVVSVSLWAQRPGVRLYDFRFEPPWRDHGFLRLPNFAESHIGQYYRLPYGWEYLREDVLNLNFLKAGWRLPSTRVEGVLCALSHTPIPEEYKHGALIPVAVRFIDRAGQQVAQTTVTLWADRLTHHSRGTQHTAEGRTAKPQTPRSVAAKSATVQPSRSSLYDPSGGNALRAADQRWKKVSPPAAKARQGGHGPGLFG